MRRKKNAPVKKQYIKEKVFKSKLKSLKLERKIEFDPSLSSLEGSLEKESSIDSSFEVPTKKKVSIKENYEDGIPFNFKKYTKLEKFEDGEILIFNPDDSKSSKEKFLEIIDVVNQNLGNTPFDIKGKTFLYVTKKKIIGVLIAEQIKKAFRIEYQGGDDTQSIAENMDEYDQEKKEKAVLGVNRIFVFQKFRGKNIATKLVDFARENLIYGYKIPKELVAFSQPTLEGKIFAMKYCKMDNFLVYGIKMI